MSLKTLWRFQLHSRRETFRHWMQRIQDHSAQTSEGLQLAPIIDTLGCTRVIQTLQGVGGAGIAPLAPSTWHP